MGERVTAVLFVIADGPDLREPGRNSDGMGISTRGQRTVLVERNGSPMLWNQDLPSEVVVTGSLKSGSGRVETLVVIDGREQNLPRLTTERLEAAPQPKG